MDHENAESFLLKCVKQPSVFLQLSPDYINGFCKYGQILFCMVLSPEISLRILRFYMSLKQ